MKKTLLCSALLAALMSVTGGAQASLVSQGAGLVLDNVNNLLWFTDSTDRNWANATSWAAGLTTGSLSAGSWSLSSFSQFGLLAAAAGYVASDSNTKEFAATNLNTLGINGTYNGFWATNTMDGWMDGRTAGGWLIAAPIIVPTTHRTSMKLILVGAFRTAATPRAPSPSLHIPPPPHPPSPFQPLRG